MNILFFFQSPMNPNKGGVQRITQTLAAEFEKRGHSVWFLSCGESRIDKTFLDNRQIYLPRGETDHEENIKKLGEILEEKNIDILVNQDSVYENVINLVQSAQKTNVKIITAHHNCISCLQEKYKEIILGNKKNNMFWRTVGYLPIWPFLKWRNRVKYGRFFKRAIDISDAFVLYFDSFKDELEQIYLNDNTAPIHTIPNPAPFKIEHSPLMAKENNILYVGRLVKTQKRVDKLMRIWKTLHDKYTDWTFDIVGDGDYKPEMEEFAKQHDLDRIRFHGTDDPRSYLEKAKIFTLTSDFEGYGMVLIEAQIYGVIPVSFRCFSAIDEVISDSNTGLIINNYDENELLKQVSYLIENENERKKMAENALEQSDKFNLEQIADKWVRLFKDVLKN